MYVSLNVIYKLYLDMFSKVLAALIILSSVFPLFLKVEANKDDYFVATAYYSPLPNQDYYLTWNYEDEKILNGQGIAWASGKRVFSGMLAAPKSYPFGTKIYLEGLGVGSVEDRGGAIVLAGKRGYSHDRIDIWMWHGEEWLKRALYWWKRKIKWSIVTSRKTSLDYTHIPAPDWTLQTLVKWQDMRKWEKKLVQKIDIFSQNLWKGSNKKYVAELQKILTKLEYLKDGDFKEGEYDTSTISAVFSMQVDSWVLSYQYDHWAGYFGPKTRKKLKIMYWEYLNILQEKERFLAEYKTLEQQAELSSINTVQTIGNVSLNQVSPGVRELQKKLAILWYLKHKDTAIFGSKTKNALITYQLEKWVITDSQAIWAWIFWPATKKQLQKDIKEVRLMELLYKKWLQKKYDEYKISLAIST